MSSAMSLPATFPATARLLPWAWPVALAAAIFYVSGRGNVAAPDIVDIDKLAHFSVYGLLATLVVRTRVSPLTALLLTSLYGVCDEYRQSFTAGRSVELADWFADTLGALLAVFICSRWHAYRRWLEAPLINSSRTDA